MGKEAAIKGVKENMFARLRDESAQMWAIITKDIRVYYFTPPMVMWGLGLPFFMFFSFSVGRGMAAESGISRLLAMTVFFTASSAGPVILPLERRVRTYDRLLTAPLSMVTLLLGKSLVGAFFGIALAAISLVVGVLLFHATINIPWLLAAGVIFSSLTFSALGILFSSGASQSPGQIMMPSTLVRWPLLFISGIFIPLDKMGFWTRAVSYLSPLTYTQDLMNHAVLGKGIQNIIFDISVLIVLLILFFLFAIKLHHRSRRLGY